MLEDYQLIRRLHRGQKQALREIYARYRECIYKTALALVKDATAAEDALSDAFVKFAAEAPNFPVYGSVRKYLARCVVRRSEEILRGKMYKIVEVERKSSASQNSDAGQAVSEREHTEEVMEAMSQVPQPQREAVAMHVYGGLSFADIAGIQQVSVNTAESRYRYGIEKLTNILDKQVDV